MSSSFMPSSRLVETVMINVEDFSDNFLTCGTCLSGYDQNEHTAKLLPCSHTICKHCIKRIIELQIPRLDHFRCPICRETIQYPAVGGANGFPPAFIVNQLLDLLANQRRDLVPTCRRHPNQELLFCETCDVVFCTDCRGRQHQRQASTHHGSGKGSLDEESERNEDDLSIDDADEDDISMRSIHSGSNCDHHHYYGAPSSQSPRMNSNESHNQILSHNVISFNVAIKRCSEILLYKAHLCVQELNSAQDAVSAELDRLEFNTDNTVNAIKSSFEGIRNLVNQREKDLLASVQRLADDKKKALSDQLSMIQSERQLVRRKCDTIKERIDVRSISRGISYLNDKLDTIASLTEPRENAFLHYDDHSGQFLLSPSVSSNMNLLRRQNTVTPTTHHPVVLSSGPKCLSNTCTEDSQMSESSHLALFRYLSKFGRISISTTYPALCTIKLPEESLNINLTDKAIIYTVDYHGHPQTSGTYDPIDVYFMGPDEELAPAKLINNADGSYHILMKPRISGLHKLSIYILQRAMRGSPFHINVRSGQRPKWTVKKGNDSINFIQPFALTSNRFFGSTNSSNIYLLDTGNCRTVILNHSDGSLVGSFYGNAFQSQAATGIAFLHPITLYPDSSDQTADSVFHSWPSQEGALVVSNWRQRSIFLVHPISGEDLYQITHPFFLEPTSVSVCPSTGRILVADNAAECIFAIQAKATNPVSFEIESLIGKDVKTCPEADEVCDEKNIRKTYSLHEKHKTATTSGFGLRRSLIKNKDQAISIFNKPSPSMKRLSLSLAKSTEKIETPKEPEKRKLPISSFKKVNGLCIDQNGTIILASGSMLQIYDSQGKHLRDLTLPSLDQEMEKPSRMRVKSPPAPNSSQMRPHSTVFGSLNPIDVSRRHVSMVEDYRHSQNVYSTSPLMNSRQNTLQSVNLPHQLSRTVSHSESSNNNDSNIDGSENFDESISDLSSRSNRSLFESDRSNLNQSNKKLDRESPKPQEKRIRNHSSNQHNGQFYGVSIGRLEDCPSKESIGDCLLATFTDRQRSMIVVWPETSWRTDLNKTSSSIDSNSTTTLHRNDLNGPFEDSSVPYVLEVNPVLRRSAGLIALENCRDLVVVDLGASSVHRLRYS